MFFRALGMLKKVFDNADKAASGSPSSEWLDSISMSVLRTKITKKNKNLLGDFQK